MVAGNSMGWGQEEEEAAQGGGGRGLRTSPGCVTRLLSGRVPGAATPPSPIQVSASTCEKQGVEFEDVSGAAWLGCPESVC